jgi:hypothetical protein
MPHYLRHAFPTIIHLWRVIQTQIDADLILMTEKDVR